MDDLHPVSIPGDDKAMQQAILAARQSLRQFLHAFFDTNPNQYHFLIKAAFEEDGQPEHIWLSDLDLMSTPPTGLIANEPTLTTLTYQQRVTFNLSHITDWMFYEDDCLVGGFTTKVLTPSMNAN